MKQPWIFIKIPNANYLNEYQFVPFSSFLNDSKSSDRHTLQTQLGCYTYTYEQYYIMYVTQKIMIM